MIARVSSQAPGLLLRDNALSLQRALARANGEVSSGRLYDVGETIGAGMSRDARVLVQSSTLNAMSDQDDAAAARVDTISTTLQNLRAGVTKLRDQLVAATQSPQTRSGLVETAKGFLDSFTAAMGQDVGGVALFGGQTLDTPSVTPYDPTRATGPAASIAAAFQSAFGMTQDSASVSTIGASAMGSFLDNTFSQQFQQPAWSAGWSRATDDAFRSQIAPTENAPTTVSANESALRDMAQLAVMVSDLGVDKLNDAAFTQLASRASKIATTAIDGSTTIETRMGVSKQRIVQAQSAMKDTTNLLARQLSASEDVDPTEAATRVNDLTSRLEATYAVTARMRDLSLLKYL